MKKTSMSNPVKSLGYIKCYSSSSPRPVKTSSNSIRYNCQKICSCSRRPKNHTGNQKKDYIFLGDQQVYYLQVFLSQNMLQSTFFGFPDNKENFEIINHLHLIFHNTSPLWNFQVLHVGLSGNLA